MATPPKTPPVKAIRKTVAPAAKSPVQKPVKKLISPPVSSDKAAPYVIEPENLSAFVDHSDSVLQPTTVPIVAETSEPAPLPAPSPTAPVPESPVAKIDAPTPPQPVVDEPVIAAIKTAATWQVPNALEGHHIMNEAIETGKKFADDAKARLQTFAVEFNDKAKSAMEKSSKAVGELTDITKGNVEALVESSKIAAKGVESIGQSAAEYGRASFEKTSATLKSFASVKSPVEFFQLQSTLLTSTFDTLAAESAKTSEAFLKLAGEIAQPISNRAAIVSDKLKALAA